MQVCLDHCDECTANARRRAERTRISNDQLQGEMGRIREWAENDTNKGDVFRLLESKFSPLRLGHDGKRKVPLLHKWSSSSVSSITIVSQ